MSSHGASGRIALLFSMLAIGTGCGPSGADLRVSVAPDPIPVLLQTCAGVFAMFPCSREDLFARFTVSVATNEVGGIGGIRVVAVDAASREPLPNQASGSVETEVVLEPQTGVTKEITWTWPVPRMGAGRIPPTRIAFIVTVRVSDTAGNSVIETVTVPESLPRSWQIF